MAAVTSINALRPPPGGTNGGGLLAPDDNAGDRIGQILAVDNIVFVNALSAALVAGCAVMLSPTSDGGALGVHIYSGSRRDKRYVSDAAQFERMLRAVEDFATAKMIGHSREVPKVPKKAT